MKTLAALIGLLVTAFAATAMAYSPMRNKQGVTSKWTTPCITLVASGDTAPIEGGVPALLPALRGASRVWTRELESCTSVAFTVVPSTETRTVVARDGVNRVFFRKPGDCHSPGLKTCLDFDTLAVTSSFISVDGVIREADIEINAISAEWRDLGSEAPNSTAFDLQNALTHEVGHLLGFAHTCFAGGEAWPIDDSGAQVPYCDSMPQDIALTTMVARIEPGDLERRTLSEDERRGLCAIYPMTDDAPVCGVQPAVGGCAMARPRGTWGWIPAGAALLIVRRRRRRSA